MHDARRTEPAARGGGIPDGLLVALLALLLGLAVLVWTATGLAALFAKGSWPDTVTFTRTPTAVRALIAQPQDLAAAWPDTDPAALSGWGLFWGLFISQLLVLSVLTIFTIGTVARTRARRTHPKKTPAPHPAPAPTDPHPATPLHPAQAQPGPNPAAPLLHPAQASTGPNQAAPPLYPAPPAFEARGSGGSAPAHLHAAPLPTPTDSAAAPPPVPTAAGPHPTQAPPGQHTATPPYPASPAFEARGSGGSAPAHLHAAPHPTPTSPAATPLHPAPPAFEAQGPGGSTPTHSAHDAYRYGFGYAPAPAPAPAAATPTPAPQGIAYAGPTDRLHAATARLADTEGAALVITSSPTLWAETKDARAKLGPVLLYDPSHLCDTPARMHWNPADGCAERDTAAARATALLAPVRPQARMDGAVADAAETLLRSWLQAAALDDRPFKQLHRWAQGNSAQDPVRILRTHPRATAGAAGELESALTAHPERRELALNLTARALSCLTSIHIREACNPNRTDALTLASFVSEGGTLYLVGEALEDPRTHPGAMPLLTALASHVVEHGRRMAARSSHGRLDPPLSLVLDDVAAVAPIPQLPELLTGDTLPVLALCRSREQARSRWPAAGL